MKYVTILIIAAIGVSAAADVVLLDPFTDGNLATAANGINGGFTVIGGGGTAEETNNVVRISNAPNSTEYGLLSTNTVSLGGMTALTTTWVISDSYLKKNGVKTMAFTWQTDGSGFDGAAEVALVLDLTETNAQFYVNGSSEGIPQGLHVNFGSDGDAFTVATYFSSVSYIADGTDDLKKSDGGELNFGAPWGTAPSTLDNLHVGVFVNAQSQNGLVIEIDSVTVETVPEPAVISLIGLAGGSMIFYRRISNRRKKSEPEV